MTYIPTKEELIEIGFLVTETHSQVGSTMRAEYKGNQTIGESYIIHMTVGGTISLGNRNLLYPDSLEDLRTLIRLLTPQ